MLVRGDDIFVIDHEAAFSFIYLLPTVQRSWEVRQRSSLTQHVFYYQLRKRTLQTGIFIARLAQLGPAELEEIIRQLPNEWRHGDLGRISTHLQAMRDHSAEFEGQLLGRLA